MAINRGEKKRIVLIGASIGRAWNFPSLAERMRTEKYIFEFIESGSFDKSPKLEELLTRSENRADMIIIKECAAYFPGDLNQYKNLIERWVRECLHADVLVMPATVIPVTKLHSFKKIIIDILKLRNPLKYGSPFRQKRNKAILEYNDWLREFCFHNHLPCLDLEAAVRMSEERRYLRRDFAQLDGLHLKSKAYKILDQTLLSTLEKIHWEER